MTGNESDAVANAPDIEDFVAQDSIAQNSVAQDPPLPRNGAEQAFPLPTPPEPATEESSVDLARRLAVSDALIPGAFGTELVIPEDLVIREDNEFDPAPGTEVAATEVLASDVDVPASLPVAAEAGPSEAGLVPAETEPAEAQKAPSIQPAATQPETIASDPPPADSSQDVAELAPQRQQEEVPEKPSLNAEPAEVTAEGEPFTQPITDESDKATVETEPAAPDEVQESDFIPAAAENAVVDLASIDQPVVDLAMPGIGETERGDDNGTDVPADLLTSPDTAAALKSSEPTKARIRATSTSARPEPADAFVAVRRPVSLAPPEEAASVRVPVATAEFAVTTASVATPVAVAAPASSTAPDVPQDALSIAAEPSAARTAILPSRPTLVVTQTPNGNQATVRIDFDRVSRIAEEIRHARASEEAAAIVASSPSEEMPPQAIAPGTASSPAADPPAVSAKALVTSEAATGIVASAPADSAAVATPTPLAETELLAGTELTETESTTAFTDAETAEESQQPFNMPEPSEPIVNTAEATEFQESEDAVANLAKQAIAREPDEAEPQETEPAQAEPVEEAPAETAMATNEAPAAVPEAEPDDAPSPVATAEPTTERATASALAPEESPADFTAAESLSASRHSPEALEEDPGGDEVIDAEPPAPAEESAPALSSLIFGGLRNVLGVSEDEPTEDGSDSDPGEAGEAEDPEDPENRYAPRPGTVPPVPSFLRQAIRPPTETKESAKDARTEPAGDADDERANTPGSEEEEAEEFGIEIPEGVAVAPPGALER